MVDADPPVHWLPPWGGPWGVVSGLDAVCGERLSMAAPVTGIPIHPESSYRVGQRAVMNGEVTCVACLAAIGRLLLAMPDDGV